MLIAITILIYLGTILFDGLPVQRSAGKMGRAAYYAILATSFSITLLFTLNVKIPNLSDFIEKIVDSLLKA